MAVETVRKRVTFLYSDPTAQEVFLCGSFNAWQPDRPMKRDRSGVWKTQLTLPPGTYEYRLIVDGEWTDDPAAEGRVPNAFGSWNCVRQV